MSMLQSKNSTKTPWRNPLKLQTSQGFIQRVLAEDVERHFTGIRIWQRLSPAPENRRSLSLRSNWETEVKVQLGFPDWAAWTGAAGCWQMEPEARSRSRAKENGGCRGKSYLRNDGFRLFWYCLLVTWREEHGEEGLTEAAGRPTVKPWFVLLPFSRLSRHKKQPLNSLFETLMTFPCLTWACHYNKGISLAVKDGSFSVLLMFRGFLLFAVIYSGMQRLSFRKLYKSQESIKTYMKVQNTRGRVKRWLAPVREVLWWLSSRSPFTILLLPLLVSGRRTAALTVFSEKELWTCQSKMKNVGGSWKRVFMKCGEWFLRPFVLGDLSLSLGVNVADDSGVRSRLNAFVWT